MNENFDGSSSLYNESEDVSAKGSCVIISQDDRVHASFLLGTLAQDWRKRTMDYVKMHVYGPDQEECLTFN